MPATITRGTRWTVTDDRHLEARWGTCGIERIAQVLNRTPCAVALRARALGLGPACSGIISMLQMERISGYDRSRILGVVARLGLRLRRAPRLSEREPKRKDAQRRRIVFSREQKAKILACLEQTAHISKLWSNRTRNTKGTAWGTGRKPAACIQCGKTDNPHKAKGACARCYRGA